MISAVQPVSDDASDYEVVATHRKKNGESRPLKLTDEVLSRYVEYEKRFLDPIGPMPDASLSEADKTALTGNADYLRLVHFNPLKKAILSAAPNRKCAYCYQLRATEVDHYLPKSVFGEYSIFSKNLVPICRACNGTKLNRYRRKIGGRRYLHPYFDDLQADSVQFLGATLSVDQSVTIKFDVLRPVGMSDELWQILQYHFNELGLDVRYMEDAAEAISGMLGVLYSHYDRGGAGELKYQLDVVRRSKARYYGANHWEPVTMGALVASEAFCEGGFMLLGPRDHAL